MNPAPTTILIVAEERDLVTLLTETLEADGYSVVGTTRPVQAIALVESTPSLILIVSDLTMSAMSGVELIRRVCRSRPELRVLFLTEGMDNVAFRESDPVLFKPFKIETFTSIVRRILTEPAAPPAIDRGLGLERRRSAAN